MDYRETPPQPELAPWIRRFWALASPEPSCAPSGSGTQPRAQAVERVVPDGRMELIVHLGDAFSEWQPDAPRGGPPHRAAECLRLQPRALLAGQLTAPLYLLPGRAIDLFAIRFEPWGAAALLGLEPAALAGRIVALGEVIGADADRLVHALAGASDFDGRVAAASAWCRTRCATLPPVPVALVAAIRAAQRSPASATVASLAAHAGAGTRGLERAFQRHIGIAPKPFLRIARLQRAIALLDRDEAGPLARVALEAGYCDQPHLTRDFLALAGAPPARFLRERRGLERLILDPEPDPGARAPAGRLTPRA